MKGKRLRYYTIKERTGYPVRVTNPCLLWHQIRDPQQEREQNRRRERQRGEDRRQLVFTARVRDPCANGQSQREDRV